MFLFFLCERVRAFHVGVRVRVCVCMYVNAQLVSRAHNRELRYTHAFRVSLGVCVCVCVYSLCVYIRTSVLRVYIHIYTHIAINMYTLCVDTIHRYDPDFIVDDCISVN